MKLKALSFFGAGATFLGMSLGMSGVAQADDVAMRPYIGESLNYIFADNSRKSDDGLGGTISGGIPLSQHFNIELGGTYAHFNHDGSIAGSEPWREYTEQLGGQYFFSRDSALAPYFGVNVGHSTEVLTQGGKDSTFFTDAGLGAIHYFKVFNTDFGVRASAAYRWTFVDSGKFPSKGVNTFGEPVLSLGLVIPIGIVKKVAAEEPTVQPIPTPTKPPLKAPPKVDVSRRFDDVHFAFDKSTLDAFARSSLDSDATVINEIAGKYPDVKVDVSGHTDWIGTDAYNQALSERRANAVEQYLTGKGVKASSIQIHAYGESKPVAPNTTKAGRALNRRVEIKTLQ
jgi:OOP family OmpA-OmpF porin